MARALNGTTEYLFMGPGEFADTAFTYGTMAVLVRPNATNSAYREIMCIGGASNDWYLGLSPTNKIELSGSSTAASYTGTTWLLIVVTKTTGTTTPRFHVYDYNTTSWTHNDGSATVGDGNVIPTTGINIGRFPSGTEFWNGDIAACALYRTWVPNDAAVEAVGFQTSASNWASSASNADRKAVWLINQASTTTQVIDVSGGGAIESTDAVGSVVSGPAGYTETYTVPGATFIQDLGSANATAATGPPNTLVLSYTLDTKPQIGDLVVVCGARDNIVNDPATADTFTDTDSNTYTRVALAQPSGTSTAAAGIVGVMFYSILTAAWSAGTNTLTWTNATGAADRAMLLRHYYSVASVRGTPDTAGAAAGVASVTTTDPVSGDLVVGMTAIEHSSASTVTPDSDTTSGTWSPQTAQVASAGTTLAAVKVVSQHKVVNATASITYNTANSVTASVDVVAIVATFVPTSAAPATTPPTSRYYYKTAAQRAATR